MQKILQISLAASIGLHGTVLIYKSPARLNVVQIATKLKVILKFLQVADHLLFGGKIFEPILQAKGILVGRPWPEKKIMEAIEEIRLTDPKIHIPVDGLASLLKGEGGYSREVGIGNLRKEEI